MRRAVIAGSMGLILGTAGPALACGGLVAPEGAVRLLRTTTLAAYHDGVEHYVTSFGFAGATGEFGSIIPLPGVPTDVRKGGRWTLQRLLQEVQPPVPVALAGLEADSARANAKVIQRHRVGALDILILRGGGRAVFRWARDHGFDLSSDAPDVLEFYARRSPIFAAARFDAARARRQGLDEGDGTPVHFAVPTDDPWIPLRILSLAKPASEVVKADLFLLTDRRPAILPPPTPFGTDGLRLAESEPASRLLLRDLRSDRGMRWLPASGMWLTYLKLKEQAGDLRYDLAVDPSGRGRPSLVDAGIDFPVSVEPPPGAEPAWAALVLGAALALAAVAERRRARTLH